MDDDSLEIVEEGDELRYGAAEGEEKDESFAPEDDLDDSDYSEGKGRKASGKKKGKGARKPSPGAGSKPAAATAGKKNKRVAAMEDDEIEPTVPSQLAAPSRTASKKVPKLTAEEKEQAKLDKKLEKQRAKAAEKRQKETAAAVAKAGRGGYAREEIAISFESSFAGTAQGRALMDGVSLEYALAKPSEVPIPNGIFWRRRKIVGVRHSAPTAAAEASGSSVPGMAVVNPGDHYVFEDEEGQLEPFVVVFWEGSTFVETLLSHGTDIIEEAVIAMRTALEPGTRVIFLIQGAAAYIHAAFERRKALERTASGVGGGRSAPLRLPPVTTQHAYESALMHLYVSRDLETKETITTQESVEYLRGLCRAIAENPYRSAPSALAVVTKIKVPKGGFAALAGGGGGAGSAAGGAGGAGTSDDDDTDSASASASGSASASSKPPKHGGGAKGVDVGETWLAMLQMIPGVSKDKALFIVRQYPSFRSLMEQYNRRDLTTEQKKDLLTDLPLRFGGKSRIRKISEDCFAFFSSEDANEVIGETVATIKAAAKQKKMAAAAEAIAAGAPPGARGGR